MLLSWCTYSSMYTVAYRKEHLIYLTEITWKKENEIHIELKHIKQIFITRKKYLATPKHILRLVEGLIAWTIKEPSAFGPEAKRYSLHDQIKLSKCCIKTNCESSSTYICIHVMKQQQETLYLKMHKYVPKLQSHKTCDGSHQWTGKFANKTN